MVIATRDEFKYLTKHCVLFTLVLNINLLTAMTQLLRAPASGAFGGLFTSRPSHTHTKDFNYDTIHLW